MISLSIIVLLFRISHGLGNNTVIGNNFTVPNFTWPNISYTMPNYTFPNYTVPNYTWSNINYTMPNYTWPNTNYTAPNFTWPNPNYTWPNINYTMPNYTWPQNNYTWPNLNYSFPNYTWPSFNWTWPNYTWPSINFTFPNYTLPNYTWPSINYTWPNWNYTFPNYTWPSINFTWPNYTWPSINYTFPNYTWPSFNWTWPDFNGSINSSRTIPPPSCNAIVLNAVFLSVAQPVDVCAASTSSSQMYTCSDQGTITLKQYTTPDCSGSAQTYSNYCDAYPYGCGQACNVDACDYFIEREYSNATGCDGDLPTGDNVSYEEAAIVLNYCSYAWTGSVIYKNDGSNIIIEVYNTSDCSDDPLVSTYGKIGDSCEVDASSGSVTAIQIREPGTNTPNTPAPVDDTGDNNETMSTTDVNGNSPAGSGTSMTSFAISVISIAVMLVFIQ